MKILLHSIIVELVFRQDKNGVISEQRNVFRINCMDCLDRTNVVQANIAREVLLITVSCRLFLETNIESFSLLSQHLPAQNYQ